MPSATVIYPTVRGAAASITAPSTAATQAAESAQLAEAWASQPLDENVEGATGGSRSALHWATKAEQYADAAETTVASLTNAVESFENTRHASNYGTLALAQAAIPANGRLQLRSGESYTHSAGRFATWPDMFCVEGDAENPAILDFSGNSTYYNDGLLKIHGSLASATEQAITKTLRRGSQYVFTSITYLAGTCTATTVDDHPFSTGDEIFIYGYFSMSAANAAFLTMKDSDEGMALSLPVTITKTGAKTFTYSPPNGGTPGASISSPSSIYCRFNDLYVGVADVSGYARGDMVHITCDDTYAGYNSSVVLDEGENNEVEYIEGSGFWLTKPVAFAYLTNPTVTKVNLKTVVLRNVEIIGTGGSSTNTAYGQADIGLYLKWTRNCVIENVTFRDCDYAGYREAQSIGNRYEDVTVYFDKLNAGGAASGFIEIQYGGWFSSGSRDAKVIRSKCFNGRHAISEAAVSPDGPGRVINLQILGADWHNQWSANFASHDMYDHILFENIRMYGGGGINVRDGNATIRNVYADGTEYVVNAYGKVENISIDGVTGKNISYAGVNLAPSNKSSASVYYEGALPNVKNVKVSNVDIEGAQFAVVARCNPNTTDNPTFYWEDFTFSNISGRNLRYYVVYLSQGGGSNTYGYKNGFVERIFGNNTSHLLYLENPIDMTFSDVRGFDAKGGATCATVTGSSAANNTFLNMSGRYVGGTAMTVFSMVSTSTGNKTDSIAYESKTISSGTITKNFRNVPVTIIDTEGAVASDDLTDILGLQKGDRVTIQTTTNARDIVVKQGAGTDKTTPGYDVTLTTTDQCLDLVHSGYGFVPPHGPSILQGAATYDPANLADGAGVTTTVTVTGAALGDFVDASFSLDLQGIMFTYWVSAADTVSVRFQNETAGAIDLGSGTITARVTKKT